jgi:hypothetical protein
MTDAPPEQPAPRSWVCTDALYEERQCFALIEDTRDSRIAHRAWHAQIVNDREALRGAIKARDEAIAGHRQEVAEFRRIVASFDATVAGLHGEVRRVETPIAPPALEISRDTYDDDRPEEPATPSWARYELDEDPAPTPTAPDALDDDEEPDDDAAEDDEAVTSRWAR